MQVEPESFGSQLFRYFCSINLHDTMKVFFVAYNVLFLRRWVWIFRYTRNGLLYASNLSCLPGLGLPLSSYSPSYIVCNEKLF